jgi:hypothetical protein
MPGGGAPYQMLTVGGDGRTVLSTGSEPMTDKLEEIAKAAVERLTRITCSFAQHIDRDGVGTSQMRHDDVCMLLGRYEALLSERSTSMERIGELLDEGALAEALERAWRECVTGPKPHSAVFNMVGRHLAHHLPEVIEEQKAARAALLPQGDRP